MAGVAVTGLGVVAPHGTGVTALFGGLLAGESRIRRLDGQLGARLRSPIAATVEFDGRLHFDPARLKMLDRVSQMALVAASQAIADAGLEFSIEDRERCGVCVGTSIGGAATTDEGYRTVYGDCSDRVKPYSVLAAMNNAPAAWIGIEHRLAGPNLTYSTACSSSAVAIGEAARRIRHGEADVMLAGAPRHR
jgi:3-oxoacyl-(acyl-carrier-protein) synthase